MGVRWLLAGIAHAPDGARSVIGNQQRSIWSDRYTHRPPPDVALRSQESSQKVPVAPPLRTGEGLYFWEGPATTQRHALIGRLSILMRAPDLPPIDTLSSWCSVFEQGSSFWRLLAVCGKSPRRRSSFRIWFASPPNIVLLRSWARKPRKRSRSCELQGRQRLLGAFPIFGWYTSRGESLDGEGVTPHIAVDVDPCQLNAGIDQQMEKAVAVTSM